MATAVVAVLALMFSTGTDEVVARHALFGAVVFETVKKDGGALGITTGVADPVPLVVLFLVLTVALLMIQVVHRGLKRRREQLLDAAGR
ncbi:hypothetical protein ABT160_29745 [Streptomyces sp. NPDC001941]|uniref:hypothetical protein n=1 Tax=Streptomyces sp. NPDC001941 TaxID=3154659 RepID=UPI00332601BF